MITKINKLLESIFKNYQLQLTRLAIRKTQLILKVVFLISLIHLQLFPLKSYKSSLKSLKSIKTYFKILLLFKIFLRQKYCRINKLVTKKINIISSRKTEFSPKNLSMKMMRTANSKP